MYLPCKKTTVAATMLCLIMGCSHLPAKAPASPGAAVVSNQTAHQEQAQAADAVLELPLKQTPTGHILLPVTIGNQAPLLFVLDTGANLSVISLETGAALGIKGEQTTVVGQGAGGDIQGIKMATLPKFKVATREYDAMAVAMMNFAPLQKNDSAIAGVLGRNFLQQQDLEFDFPHHIIRLYPTHSSSHLPTNPGNLVEIPYEESGFGLIQLKVQLNGG